MTSARTAIITGGYGAIGRAIAEGIAKMPGYRVVIIGRDRSMIEQTACSLMEATGNKDITGISVDLGRKKEIIDFAAAWKGPLHVLINNAATAPRKKSLTAEGIEMQWAVNVLGYFWMMQNMRPKMAGQQDARVVNVASYWAGGLDIDDPEFIRRPYDNDDAYRQSKQADRMLSRFFSVPFAADGIAVNSCHPGDVNSKLSNALGFGGHESPEKGASTPIWVATSPEISTASGKYFEHQMETECIFSGDQSRLLKLYEVCRGY
jgi:NAD(P)-dependent dehydrogenase (short-subunit alcohol dehydrogenase family)